jgi:hypothetical protein
MHRRMRWARYHGHVRTRAQLSLLLALAACAGARPDASRADRAQRDPSLPPLAPLDVTAAWDAEPPASGQGERFVSLDAQWAVHGALPLRALDARVVVQGPLALTELHLVYENTTNHLIEANPNKLVVPSWAQFDLRLPPGGAVTRFAHEQPEGWLEAEMVAVAHDHACLGGWWAPKMPPRVTEETPGHPAHFDANVDPIRPHSLKSIVVAFTQPLVAPGEPYRLPLLGLPRLDRLDAVVYFPLDPQRRAVAVHKRGWTPDRDWTVAAPPGQPNAIRSGPFVVARIARPADAADVQQEQRTGFLVDTSASRSARLQADADRLAAIVKELRTAAPQGTVLVAAFDQDVEPIYAGAPGDFGAAELARLTARGSLGATDLGAALRWATRQRVDRLVLLSDGVPTLGGRTASDLGAALAALRVAGANRIDVTTSDDERGAALLTALASGLEQPGAVFGPDEGPSAIVARMTHAAIEPIEVPGALWSWPKEVRAGAPVTVFAELPPRTPLDVRLSGRSVRLDVRDAASPLVDEEAARAEVALLESGPAPSATDPEPARATLASLSTRYRVLSRESRWLVPDSDQQYATLGVDRATTPLLAVGAADVEANARAPLHLLPARRTLCLPGPAQTHAPGFMSDLVGRSLAMPVRVLLEKGREGFSAKELAALKTPLKERLFERNPAPGGLEVEGYSRDSAIESENLRVSRARATALRDALSKLGFDARARGYGSLPPLVGFFEYDWSDGAGPLTARQHPERPGLPSRYGRVGPDTPALGTAPKGDVAVRLVVREPPEPLAPAAEPYAGKLAEILSTADKSVARDLAESWHGAAPTDPMAAIALGLARDLAGDSRAAARAFGSLVDLAPGSASVGRSCAAFLERDDPALALEVLQETGVLEKDQAMTSRWALGLALARAGKLDESVETLASTLDAWMGARSLANGDLSDFRELQRVFMRAPSVLDVLEHELSVVAAATVSAHPDEKAALIRRLAPFGVEPARGPSLRFALTWEADIDVDLQVASGKGPWDPGASSTRDARPGEGIVIDDVKAFGPEEYVVNGAARAYPYRVRAQLRGAAAGVTGRVDVLDYDGAGHLRVEARPFVVQVEGGTVDVMVVDAHGVHSP